MSNRYDIAMHLKELNAQREALRFAASMLSQWSDGSPDEVKSTAMQHINQLEHLFLEIDRRAKNLGSRPISITLQEYADSL